MHICVAICGYIWYNRHMEAQYHETHRQQVKEFRFFLRTEIDPQGEWFNDDHHDRKARQH